MGVLVGRGIWEGELTPITFQGSADWLEIMLLVEDLHPSLPREWQMNGNYAFTGRLMQSSPSWPVIWFFHWNGEDFLGCGDKRFTESVPDGPYIALVIIFQTFTLMIHHSSTAICVIMIYFCSEDPANIPLDVSFARKNFHMQIVMHGWGLSDGVDIPRATCDPCGIDRSGDGDQHMSNNKRSRKIVQWPRADMPSPMRRKSTA